MRIIDDYSHIDDETPSLSISLYRQYRGQGIGTALMKTMLSELKTRGYAQISLSVQKTNYAARMYRQLSFETVTENEDGLVMRCRLNH